MLTLRRVCAEDCLRGTAAVEDHDVDDQPGVFDERLQMLLCGVAVALTGLRHHVADVHTQRPRLP
jgi:hypothetical protein